jgi:large subunit ribosomal protein L15
MDLHQLHPKTPRKMSKRVGRGGKRGTFSGGGSKGQKSRAGAGVKPGFRGGDNRLWQLFPKQRGATSKPGNKRPHHKHRYFQLRHSKTAVVNLDALNQFPENTLITPELLLEKGVIVSADNGVKILSNGILNRKLEFQGFEFSATAKEKIAKSGGIIK